MGRVYAVASGKGGVGKTTTVANLGAALAEAGHETVLVDVDLGMGNLAGVLGVDADAGATVHDVLAGSAMVAEAVHEGPAGLSVLPASADLDDFGTADPTRLAALLDGLAAEFVLLDTSAGLSHDSVEPLRIADEVLLVSTAETGALGDTAKTREVADRFGTPVWGAVVTRATPGMGREGGPPSGDRPQVGDVGSVANRLGVTVRGTIPDDPAVSAAAEAGEPLITAAPDAPATDAYRRLAAELSGDDSLAPADDADEGVVVADAEAVAREGDAEAAETGGGGTQPVTRDEPATTAAAGETDHVADADVEAADEAAGEVPGEPNTAATDESATENDDASVDEGSPAEDEGNERTGFLRWLLG
jgi:septum site-determining protein MinD